MWMRRRRREKNLSCCISFAGKYVYNRQGSQVASCMWNSGEPNNRFIDAFFSLGCHLQRHSPLFHLYLWFFNNFSSISFHPQFCLHPPFASQFIIMTLSMVIYALVMFIFILALISILICSTFYITLLFIFIIIFTFVSSLQILIHLSIFWSSWLSTESTSLSVSRVFLFILHIWSIFSLYIFLLTWLLLFGQFSLSTFPPQLSRVFLFVLLIWSIFSVYIFLSWRTLHRWEQLFFLPKQEEDCVHLGWTGIVVVVARLFSPFPPPPKKKKYSETFF